MPMSKEQPMTSKDEIAKSLRERASDLWGQERADDLQSLIQQTAGHIWQLSQDLPPTEEEPGFYL